MTGDDVKTYSGEDAVAWFREVSEEIDDTPARLKILAARRRELARTLVQAFGVHTAAERAGVTPGVLLYLAAESWNAGELP
jgi:hypothetical protein